MNTMMKNAQVIKSNISNHITKEVIDICNEYMSDTNYTIPNVMVKISDILEVLDLKIETGEHVDIKYINDIEANELNNLFTVCYDELGIKHGDDVIFINRRIYDITDAQLKTIFGEIVYDDINKTHTLTRYPIYDSRHHRIIIRYKRISNVSKNEIKHDIAIYEY